MADLLQKQKSLKDIFQKVDSGTDNDNAAAASAIQRAEFEKYNELQQSRVMFLVYCVLYLSVTLTIFIFQLSFPESAEMQPGSIRMRVHVSSICMEFLLMLSLVLLVCIKFWAGLDYAFLIRLLRFKGFLQNFFVLGNIAILSVQLLGQSVIGECNDEYNGLYCAHYPPAYGPSPAIIMAMVVIPMAFYFVMRDTRFEIILLSWLLSVIVLVVNFATKFRPDHWLTATAPVLLFTIGMFMIYYESHRQNLAMYLLTRQLQLTLIENEKLADETHANEMRAMIANVAHDLKTPLTSFLAGVDFISHIIEDMEDKTTDDPSSTEGSIILDSIQPMRDCLSSIHNTNAFMIMTINRCIDYTKASKGMKLVPKQETIHLKDTIKLPLQVMRDMQQRREITLDQSDAVNKNVCSHIITDKQWLQENLLCLLSNAVKYSSKGDVNIRISLLLEKEVQPKKQNQRKRRMKLKSTAKTFQKVALWSPGRNSNNRNKLTAAALQAAAGSSPSTAAATVTSGATTTAGSVGHHPSAVGVTNLKSTDELDRAVEYHDIEVGDEEEDDDDDEDSVDDVNHHINNPRALHTAAAAGMFSQSNSNASLYSIVKSKALVSKVSKTKFEHNPSVTAASPSIKQLRNMWRTHGSAESRLKFPGHSRNPSSASIGGASSTGLTAVGGNGIANEHAAIAVGDIERGVSGGFASSNNSLVSISEAPLERHVLKFEVQDSGIGLSDEAMKNLFNPFKQAQRLAGGTGLGLYSLAKRLEALGGYFGVERRKDGQKGSVFWFAIVYRPDKVSAAMHDRSRAARKMSLVAEGPDDCMSSQANSPTAKATDTAASVSPTNISSAIRSKFSAAAASVATNNISRGVDMTGATSGDGEEKTDAFDEQLLSVSASASASSKLPHQHATKAAAVAVVDEERIQDGVTVVQQMEFSSKSGSDRGDKNTLTSSTQQQQQQQLPPVSGGPTAARPTARQSPRPAPKLATMSKSVSRIIDTYQTPEHMDILLVDDSISILKMTTMMLKRQGHRVAQAENGAEALEMMIDRYHTMHRPFDVVVMDLQMPVMDGLESVSRLRQEERTMSVKSGQVVPFDNATAEGSQHHHHQQQQQQQQQQRATGQGQGKGQEQEQEQAIVMMYTKDNRIKSSFRTNAPLETPAALHQTVIGCSANSDHETMQQALQAGVDAFMAKPFSIDTFYAILSQLRAQLKT